MSTRVDIAEAALPVAFLQLLLPLDHNRPSEKRRKEADEARSLKCDISEAESQISRPHDPRGVVVGP
jgi:hypothetical protein